MLTAKESTRLLDLNHRLRELYVQKAEAQHRHDHPRVDELQAEIDALTADCDRALDAEEAL
jgi:hypothetical protein